MVADASHDAPRKEGEASDVWTDLQTVPNLLSISRLFTTVAAAGLYFYGYRKLGMVMILVGLLSDTLL